MTGWALLKIIMLGALKSDVAVGLFVLNLVISIAITANGLGLSDKLGGCLASCSVDGKSGKQDAARGPNGRDPEKRATRADTVTSDCN